MVIGWRGPSAFYSYFMCRVYFGGRAGYSAYSNADVGIRPVVSIPASGAPAGLKTALGLNN